MRRFGCHRYLIGLEGAEARGEQEWSLGGVPSPYRPQPPPDWPKFTADELQEMHDFCLLSRDLARGGGTPTKEQSENFMAFQKVCYAEGIACE